MANSKSFAENLSELQALYSKLENGQLTRDEVQDLTYNARELYERSLIIQYKIFEGSTVDVQAIDQQVEEIEESAPSIEETVESTDAPAFDLSLFDASAEAEVAEEIVEETPEDIEELEEVEEEIIIEADSETSSATLPVVEEVIEEPVAIEPMVEEIKEAVIEETVAPVIEEKVEAPVVNTQSTSGTSLVDRLRQLVDPSESQFGMGGLTSLVGSFGLNERLLYINELFGGSSEEFAKAIQALDVAGDFNQALAQIDVFAQQYNWNLGSESVSDFVNKLKRRYA